MTSDFLKSTLQATIDGASKLSKRVFGRKAMRPEEVEGFLNEHAVATLVTMKPNGGPHASIGSFCCYEGKLYFYSNPASARHRNLTRNRRVAVTVVDGWRRQVIVEGEASVLGVASDLTSHKAADCFRKKYGQFAGDKGSSSYVVEVTPRKIFTYRSKG